MKKSFTEWRTLKERQIYSVGEGVGKIESLVHLIVTATLGDRLK